MHMELYQLKNLCRDMADLGVAKYLKEMKPSSDLLSTRAAYELYTRTRVNRWIEQGLVTPRREGSARNSKRYLSRTELLEAENAEKLAMIINNPYNGKQ